MGFLHHFVGGRTFLANRIDPCRKFAIAVPRPLTQYPIDFAKIFLWRGTGWLGMICRSGKVCRGLFDALPLRTLKAQRKSRRGARRLFEQSV
jgi:hypothetical protein